MAGTLFVVATPIGNLEDITLRALRTLRNVQLIAAEDTRRTARLLAHHGISTPTLSFHEHNTRSRLPQLLARLDSGADLALVTDAGTPGISDPGTELIRACADGGITVDVIPGPSAPLVAAVASGFPLDPLTILGFPPARAKDRNQWLEEAGKVPHTFTFFEAPHRITETLHAAGRYFGDRPIIVARELTKLHQEYIRANRVADIIGQMTTGRGEYTVVIGPQATHADASPTMADSEIATEFGQVAKNGAMSRRQVVSTLAKKSGRSSREVYAIIERARKLVI